MTNKAMIEKLMEQNEMILKNLDSLNQRVTAIEKSEKESQTLSKSGKTKTSKKSSEPKQSREERLTEKFGDKETRTKFVELRKKVADEFASLAKANEKYIPKKSYVKTLNSTTESLNGKFNKATVKKAFLVNAK